jgi:hypothetical protein
MKTWKVFCKRFSVDIIASEEDTPFEMLSVPCKEIAFSRVADGLPATSELPTKVILCLSSSQFGSETTVAAGNTRVTFCVDFIAGMALDERLSSVSCVESSHWSTAASRHGSCGHRSVFHKYHES